MFHILWLWSLAAMLPSRWKSARQRCDEFSHSPLTWWESAIEMRAGKAALQISFPSLYPECKVTAAAQSPCSMQTGKWAHCWGSQALDWDLERLGPKYKRNKVLQFCPHSQLASSLTAQKKNVYLYPEPYITCRTAVWRMGAGIVKVLGC